MLARSLWGVLASHAGKHHLQSCKCQNEDVSLNMINERLNYSFFQGAKKLCPQCNTITSPGDLRRVFLWPGGGGASSVFSQSGGGLVGSWPVRLPPSSSSSSSSSRPFLYIGVLLNSTQPWPFDLPLRSLYKTHVRCCDINQIWRNIWNRLRAQNKHRSNALERYLSFSNPFVCFMRENKKHMQSTCTYFCVSLDWCVCVCVYDVDVQNHLTVIYCT